MPRTPLVVSGHAERHFKMLKPKVIKPGNPDCVHHFIMDRKDHNRGVCKFCGEERDWSIGLAEFYNRQGPRDRYEIQVKD